MALILLVVVLGFLLLKVARVPLSPSSLGVYDVAVTEENVSFSVMNANSAVSVSRWYQCRIENGQLRITFYGTLLPVFAMGTDRVSIDVSDAQSVSAIVIAGKGDDRVAWSMEP